VVAGVREAFAAAGLETELHAVAAGGLESTLRVLASTSGILAVGGGDGTHSTAAGTLAGTDTALVPVPLGTHNHFGRRLGIDSPVAAARAAAEGRRVRLPVGSVNGRPFVNNVSIGTYPRFVRTRERLRPQLGYEVASILAGLHALWRLRQLLIDVEACGARRQHAVAGIWFGLGHGSFRLPGEAAPIAARTLEVVIAPGHRRLRLVAHAIRTLGTLRRGDPPQRAGLETFHAPVVKLRSAGLLDLARDGEAERVTPPVTLLVMEGALQVCSLEPISAADVPVPCPEPARRPAPTFPTV
jgi:diacylglycerol kinase family enzyme